MVARVTNRTQVAKLSDFAPRFAEQVQENLDLVVPAGMLCAVFKSQRRLLCRRAPGKALRVPGLSSVEKAILKSKTSCWIVFCNVAIII